MKIHFLNVGHGDCTIIEHSSGRLTMIDINNGDDLDPTSASEIAEETPSAFDNKMLPFAEALHVKRATILANAGYEVALANPIQFLTDNYPGRPLFANTTTRRPESFNAFQQAPNVFDMPSS